MSLGASFKGKKVLVTGVGQGIGRALAKRLHEYGAITFGLSKDTENLTTLVKECPSVIPIAVDLINWDATKSAIERIDRVDYLINNAGIIEPAKFLDIKPEQFDRTLGVNLKSVINVSQIVAKRMIKEGKPGSILNMSSICSKVPVLPLSLYSTSKAGVDSLTRAMAQELGQYKIRVNALNPGPVDTPMLQSEIAYFKQLGIDQTFFQPSRLPMGEAMTPMDQIVNTALFLLSLDMAPMIDGVTLVVDCGFSVS